MRAVLFHYSSPSTEYEYYDFIDVDICMTVSYLTTVQCCKMWLFISASTFICMYCFMLTFLMSHATFFPIFLSLPGHLHLRFKHTSFQFSQHRSVMAERAHAWVNLITGSVPSCTHHSCLCWFSSVTRDRMDNSQVCHYLIYFYTGAAKVPHPCWAFTLLRPWAHL